MTETNKGPNVEAYQLIIDNLNHRMATETMTEKYRGKLMTERDTLLKRIRDSQRTEQLQSVQTTEANPAKPTWTARLRSLLRL